MGLVGDQFMSKSLTLTGDSGAVAWKKLVKYADNCKYADSVWMSLKAAVLHYVWPRLDANVTKHKNHLNKSVFSVHPKTGRVCVPIIGNIMNFDPSTCPKYVDLVKDDKPSLSMFNKHVKKFERFLEKLKVSPSEVWRQPRFDVDEPASFSMVSKKRDRQDEYITPPHYRFDLKRVCANTVRVFVAVASSLDPNRVHLFFYTRLVEDAVVSVVWPGYAPPSRVKQRFPQQAFLGAIEEASRNPGSEVVCDEAFVGVLFNPAISEVTAEMRVKRLEARLQEGVRVCSVNRQWGELAIIAMLKDSAIPSWNTKYVCL